MSDSQFAKKQLEALLAQARDLIPDQVPDLLPVDRLTRMPAFHPFEKQIGELGWEAKEVLVRVPRLRADKELQRQIVDIACDARAVRGRWPFVQIVSMRAFAEHGPRLLKQVDQPFLTHFVIDALYKMRSPGHSARLEPFLRSKVTDVVKATRRYLLWDGVDQATIDAIAPPRKQAPRKPKPPTPPGKPKTGGDDWFRNTEWNDEIEEAFHARLKRSRGSRDQKLKIQVVALLENAPKAALELADFYFKTRKDSTWDMFVHDSRAQARLKLNNIPGAIAAYKDALEAMREWPNFRPETPFDFAMLVATRKLRSEYDLALQGLRDRGEDELRFPAHFYQWHGAHALILDDLGQLERATKHAEAALEAAERTESPFRDHRELGLVGPKSKTTIEQLDQIRARAERKR